jgi:hypothetical protein
VAIIQFIFGDKSKVVALTQREIGINIHETGSEAKCSADCGQRKGDVKNLLMRQK